MAAPKLDPLPMMTRPAPAHYPPSGGVSGIATVPPAPRVPQGLLPLQVQDGVGITTLDGLGELHLALSARLLQLEIVAASNEASACRKPLREYVAAATALRGLLLRASMGARVAEKLALTGFEAMIGESLRWAYLWAIEELESSICALGGEPRIETPGFRLHRQAVSLLPSVIDELDAEGEPAERVVTVLGAIDETSRQVVRKREVFESALSGL